MAEVFNLMDHFVKKARTHQLLEDSILFAFLGRRRSGKSTDALALCKKIDPDMTIEQVVFTNKEFRDATREYKKAAIFWDEPSVTAYSREYQDEANRLLNKTLQVFGYKRLVIALAYQHASFLDKHTRWLVDVYFICSSEINVNELSRRNFIDPRVLLTDWVREPYLAPYQYTRNGRLVEMGKIPVPQLDDLLKWAGINKKFYHEYQRKKEEFFESAEWESENEREKEMSILKRYGIDGRQLRRLLREDFALQNLVDELYNRRFTYVDIANMAGIEVNTLRSWIRTWKHVSKFNLVNQEEEPQTEFQD
ncbi:hypothetical protein DRP07_00655 [Archaeoglobales archaeon]|nr:MAG: hypothetical protein DRP07_00655 [Archaeoglobales archaeon]